MSNRYYLFSTKPIDGSKSVKTVLLGKVTVAVEKIKRFTLLGLPSNTELLVYEAIPSNIETQIILENGYCRADCNIQIHAILQDNSQIYGSSSISINSILSKIILIDKSNEKVSFRGDEGWDSLKSLFKTLDSPAIKYVVLRKYETLPECCLENDHDIDILCESKDLILLATGAEKRNIGISGYSLIINGIKTDFDIRYLGDDYLDSNWQRDILENRIAYNKYVYVMDKTNLLFSLLYHNLTQKKTISNYYKEQIKGLSNAVLDFEPGSNNSKLCKLLASYMRTNSYQIRKPHDVGVVQNKANIRILKKLLRPYPIKSAIIRDSYIKTPYRIRKFLPNTLKQKMNKYE